MFSLFRFLPRRGLTNLFFDYWNQETPSNVDRVLGGAMVLRKKALEQVGLFDESYFIYAEEVDLCYRMKKMKWQVSPIPGAKIYHYHEQSSLQNMKTITFHRIKSDFIFFKKFYPFYQVVILRLIQFFGASLKSLFWLMIFLFHSNKGELAKNKLLGYTKVLLSNFTYSKSLL